MNQVLGISTKQICLSLSDVATSLRRALLVDALRWRPLSSISPLTASRWVSPRRWYYYNLKQPSGGVLQKRCSYEFCKIHKKTAAQLWKQLRLVFKEAADLQSLTLSKKEIPTMFSSEFYKISHNTIFKEPEKLSISTKKTPMPMQMFDQFLNTRL